MNIEMTRSLGEIASEDPGLIPLMEEMKLDYCCGGNRSLKEACALAGISAEVAVQRMEKGGKSAPGTPVPVDWKARSVAEITAHILEMHHAYTREALVRLKELASKTARVHGSSHPELFRLEVLIGEMAEEMEGHMAKEEEQVFPYLRAVEKAGWKKEGVTDPFQGGPIDNHPLKVLMWEHGMTGEEFLEIHRLTGDFTLPGDACASFKAFYAGLRELEEDLHRHVHLENNVLFHKAMERGVLD